VQTATYTQEDWAGKGKNGVQTNAGKPIRSDMLVMICG
jgi:hypothetical protein